MYTSTIPVLPATEQSELALAAQNGCEVSMDILIESNIPLTHKIAKMHHLRNPGVEFEDLLQIAKIGVIRAIEKFDPNRKGSFSTVMRLWIDAEIFRFLLESAGNFKMSQRGSRKIFLNLGKAKRKLQKEGKECSVDNIAKEIGVSAADVRKFLGVFSSFSKDTICHSSDFDGDFPFENVINKFVDDTAVNLPPNPENQTMKILASRILHEAFASFSEKLSERERFIFEHNLLAEGKEQMSMKDIGAIFGLSRQRIHQIKDQVVEKLKKHLESEERFKDACMEVLH